MLLLYLSYWAIFGTIHSVLAMNTIKSKIPLSPQMYRIVYNIINSITFLIVIWLTPSPEITKIFQMTVVQTIVFSILMLLGLGIFLWGVSAWHLPGFLGIAEEPDTLTLDGPYRFSRHPVYTGVILMLLALQLPGVSEASLAMLLGIGGYFIIGAQFEEYKLKQAFGEKYRAYQKRVGQFFPFKLQHLKTLLKTAD